MSREIQLEYPEEGATLRVELLDDDAPRTCATIWDALPFDGPSVHAIYSGTLVAIFFDPTIVVGTENATTFIQTGDVMFTHYDANERHGHPQAISEIYVAYDRYVRPTVPGLGGPAEANVFGKVVGDPTDFYAVSRRLPVEGAKRLLVTRVE